MPTIEELQRFQFEDFALENTRRGKLTVLGEHAFGMEQGRIVTAPVRSERTSRGSAGEPESLTIHLLLHAELVMPLYDADLDEFVDTPIPLDDDEDDLTTSVVVGIPSLGGDVTGSHTPFTYHFNWVIGADFHPDLYPSGTYLTDVVLPCEGTNNFGVSGGFTLSLIDPGGGVDVGTLTTPLDTYTIYATGETTEITSFDAWLYIT